MLIGLTSTKALNLIIRIKYLYVYTEISNINCIYILPKYNIKIKFKHFVDYNKQQSKI